ncbi:hypothetical protein S83_011979, partial [Arachis hypogaea]
LAMKMVELNESIATARGNEDKETGLPVLAQKYSLCSCLHLRSRRHLLHSHNCKIIYV